MEVGKDGKTALERSRRKKAKVMGVELGEKLLWMKRQKDNQKMGKIEARWEYGVFCGGEEEERRIVDSDRGWTQES